MSNPIRVLVVDDHAAVRSGLRRCSTRRATSRPSARRPMPSERSSRRSSRSRMSFSWTSSCRERAGSKACPPCCRPSPTRRCSCSRCRTTRGTSARRSRPARAAMCSRRQRTPRWSTPCAPSPRASATSTLLSAPGSSRRMRRSGAEPGKSRCPIASGSPTPARPQPHEPGDREDALHLGSHRRDAPGAHHAETPPLEPCGARPLRAQRGAARGSSASARSPAQAAISSQSRKSPSAARKAKIPHAQITAAATG
jgi:hypothetical protein